MQARPSCRRSLLASALLGWAVAGIASAQTRRDHRRHSAAPGQHRRRVARRRAGAQPRRVAGLAAPAELDDARDEAIYLKVKLRKNEPIARSEYSDVRDRDREHPQPRARRSVDSAAPRTDADRDRQPRPASAGRRADAGRVPVGTEFDVRLQHAAQLGDGAGRGSLRGDDAGRSRATATACSCRPDRSMRGVVSSVNKAGRIERKGSLTVAFDQITVERPRLSDSRDRDAGARERRHPGRGRRRSAPAPASARSSAASSAASKARWPAF